MRRAAARAALAALALLAAGVLAIGAAAAADPVRLGEPAALDLARVALVVPDDGRVAGPDELAALVGRDGPVEAAAPASGGDGGAVWMATRVANETAEARWVVLFRHALLARIDLWVYDGGTVAAHASAGVGLAGPEARPAFAAGYEFPLALPAGETRTLVLRLEPVLSLFGNPVLAPLDAARADTARRRIVFPLLLDGFLGMAALHVVLFVRFGGVANLLFVGTVVSLFLDWFVWLGGPHDLGFGPSVAATVQMSTATWFTASFFITTFCLHFFSFGRRATASYAALLGAFALLVAAYAATASLELQLAYVIAFHALSAGILLANGVAAVRAGVSGARLALVAYAILLANELLTYGSLAVPWLAASGEALRASLGLFDTGTLLSQILTNGLFSLALWERVRATTREREAALRAERLKTVHVAQLSHDIRSPLHAVQSAIGALVAGSPPSTAGPRQVEVVQSAVRSVVAMLDDMADLARNGRATQAARRGAVDIRRVVADAAAVARAELADRPVALRVEVADAVPALVGGDGVAVRRVLGNLLANAVSATREGAVAIAVSSTGAGSGARVRFEVRDTGSGMSERRVAELFGPSAGGEGRLADGLGLEVARRLAAAIGGALGASSRPGAGTTVWFEMPAPPVPDGLGGRGPAPVGATPRLRLLLVEDDELAAAATTVILTVDGHDVTHVRAASEAVDLTRTVPFDLVLMDLHLDAGPGLEAVRAIRAIDHPVRSGVPIVIATGDREAGENARLTPLGVRSVLIKPFDVAELRRAIADGIRLGAGPAAPGADDAGGFVADLAALLPPAGLRTLLETGRDQIRAGVEALEAASSAGRLRDAKRFAHRLASSAGVLGLGRLTAAARTAETAAEAADHDALRAAVGGARTAAEAALAELDRRLAPAA